MTQVSHLHSPASLHLSISSHSLKHSPTSLHLSTSNHSLRHFQFFLYRKKLLTPYPLFHSPTSKLKSPLPIMPLSVAMQRIFPTTLHLTSIFSLKTHSTSFQSLTSMIHQLTNLHHLPSNQKLAQHWFQNLTSHLPPLSNQQSRRVCLTFFQRYQLRKPKQGGGRESEIMKRKTERSMQNGKEKMRPKCCTNRLVDVSKIDFHNKSDDPESGRT